MAFDGNGNWISTFSAVADRDAGIKILASRFDNIFINDIAQSFENCLTKDGQVKTQVNFDVNNNRIINVVDPINDYDGANKAYVDYCIAHVEQDPLFAFKWADYEIQDQSWLNANTFSWQDGTVYTNAYSHLVDDLDGATEQSETIGSYTIYYKLGSDGHKICGADQETNAANIYNESGVAWYYILDTANQRFKLPRENPNREKLKTLVQAPVVGNGYGLGLISSYPNGAVSSIYSNADSELTTSSGGGVAVGSSNNTNHIASNKILGVSERADKSGLVAKLDSANTTSVSYYKGQKYLYFYVGQFTQSATEQTAGLNAELFNGKVDLNAANLSDAGKSLIAGLGMPSDTYEDLTLLASGQSYAAPANGYYMLSKASSASGQYIWLITKAPDNTIIYDASAYSSTSSGGLRITVPAKKGDSVTVSYTAGGTTDKFRFVYAQGSESEAS